MSLCRVFTFLLLSTLAASSLAAASAPTGAGLGLRRQNEGCIPVAECTATLVREFNWGTELTADLCSRPPESEWGRLRERRIFARAIRDTRWLIAHDLYSLSAMQLLLFAYGDHSLATVDEILGCSGEFRNGIGVRITRAWDVCEPLVTGYPDSTRERLYECARAYLGQGNSPDESLDTCIEEIFYP